MEATKTWNQGPVETQIQEERMIGTSNGDEDQKENKGISEDPRTAQLSTPIKGNSSDPPRLKQDGAGNII
ncbi:hypothetical protein IGI04_007930 [Brassica rapa subsp. trilocularis]|uniref:Uncharacterized protein n=1 Tax=Brassica rapa subsp. trilocularis TaxID=1813537 RepID=A0ABQ7NMC6_BRACM|nr:hypothetical protein IGI04_007930 [Brassica rapa subsp. trilocularis]